MSKMKRIEQLLLSINSKKQFTLKELADEFQVSTRTIQRDLIALMEMGLPIVSEFGPNGGYRIDNDRILPPIGFTEMEAFALLQLLHPFEEDSFPYQTVSRSVSKKLMQFLPEDTKEQLQHYRDRLAVHLPLPKSSPVAAPLFEAALKQKIVTIVFRHPEGKIYSNIQPIGLFSENGKWYCPAFCYTLLDFFVYDLSLILNAAINYEPMEVKDFSYITISNWLKKIEPKFGYVLNAKLTEEGVDYCLHHPLLSQIVTINPDGSVDLQAKIPQSELNRFSEYMWVLRNRVSVMSPSEIKDQLEDWKTAFQCQNELLAT